jgi:hypothetical protein
MGNYKEDRDDLTQIMNSLIQDSDCEEVTIGQILDTLEHRGFGPLLVAPALLIILPTGAIPGFPAICGIFIFLVSFQLMIGKQKPWLPKRFEKISIDKERLKNAFKKMEPWANKIDSYVQNRLEFLLESQLSKVFVALTSNVLAVGIIFIGFVPMIPAVLALPILFFALGLSVRDGILMAIGYAVVASSLFSLPFLI